MTTDSTLKFILIFAILGMALSGYLSYYNLFAEGCSESIISCGNNPVEIFGLPNCVYGLVMYFIAGILSVFGLLKHKNLGIMRWLIIIGVVGTLFAFTLSVYELWVVENPSDSLPACAYGFFIYLAILIFSVVGYLAAKKANREQLMRDQV